MSRVIMLIPTSIDVSLNSISLGLSYAIKQKGISLSLFKPIGLPILDNKKFESTVHKTMFNDSIIRPCNPPLSMNYVEYLLSSNQQNVLIDKIVTCYHENIQESNIVLIEGLILTSKQQFTMMLNNEIAWAFNAEIILVLELSNYSAEYINKLINLVCLNFGDSQNKNTIGIIVNKINAPINKQGQIYSNLLELFENDNTENNATMDQYSLFKNSSLPILGYIPWNFDLTAVRAIDIARHLDALIIQEGTIYTRRVKSVVFCTYGFPNILENFKPGSLLIIPADRFEMLIAACLAALNGIEITAILLTDGCEIELHIRHLCERALKTGMSIFSVKTNIWQTALNLQNFSLGIPPDDHCRMEKLQHYIASYIDVDWIKSLSNVSKKPRRLSAASFRYHLNTLARQAKKCILLPEGDEERTIQAASICAKRGIAKCILLGDPEQIKHVAKKHNVELCKTIKIIDPSMIRREYVNRLMELRKAQGMTRSMACEQLEDNVMLGTLMLEQGKVDGLVSGAVHTTTHTIRPSLQLIKPISQKSLLVSSIFFMLLPEQVLIYGDCAINPNPSAEQLAEIAIQSADSAVAFGIEPYVAMISYSTGNSGAGNDVDKVRKATQLAKNKRPNLMIDGPLQYDAAILSDVASLKAPNSPVAGKATIFIFPDLNTGNTTYKAVQRSTNIISIGPMLQGMRKPVNDLSRGALVEDIVYTIALTAVQSKQMEGYKS
ncbi:phosphate acetyltransferase [Candidatus Curculioniphilus buchneri]|uniref:phosphate acetyltransferase n=1 Tax=Candidatus Curculioniphilus buchneri TaxID=690594 RepID=UPI00376F035C